MDTNTRLLKNNSYYDRFAAEVGARSEARDFTKALNLFLETVDSSKKILDIGCGSGIHLLEFKKRGFKALGVEPSSKMRELCHSQGLDCVDGAFESIETLKLGDIGGIWCASSLLHVPKENFRSTLLALGKLLPSSSPLYFTVRLGEGAKWDKFDGADADVARFIQLYTEKEILQELSHLTFTNIQSWIEDSTWGRPSQWISVMAQKGKFS